MSYILDALRRADAERERSAAPGLNTQHLDARGPDDDAADEPRRRAWPIAIGAIVGLGAALAWSLFGREPVAPVAPPIPKAVEQPVERAPAPPAVAIPAPPPPAPAAPPAVVTSLPPIPPPAPPAERPAPVRAAITVAAPPTASAVSAASPASAAAVTTAKAAPVASAATPEPRIPSQAELPDELRREIPPLVVGGAMYSPTPANRMLILNGQVTHEGDQPAPGLVLEQINLKTAVLRYKGQRFRIAY